MITSYQYLSAWLQTRASDERGASLVEYALLLALIAVVCIAAIGFIGSAANDNFNSTGSAIDGA